MACFGFDEPAPEPVGVCPDCGTAVSKDGFAIDYCAYSPVLCESCDHWPCDQSCRPDFRLDEHG